MNAKQIVRLMNEEERNVYRAVEAVEAQMAEAGQRAAQAFTMGGRVIYVGAGTSGRIAAMDAAEMPPTFGIESDRFIALIAGGSSAENKALEDAEDDLLGAVSAINDLHLSRKDIVIGIAASGATPFVVGAVRHARQKGVWTCGIANNRKSPLLEEADLGIFLDTGPEVLTGSTRLKAGTAQKLALNRISTTAMVLSGKVVENLMVDVKAQNGKLKERCCRIVTELTNVTRDEAQELLEAHDWSIRAVLEHLHDAKTPIAQAAG
jgi:N-acetylmuramic acid 6-phosphate etherase